MFNPQELYSTVNKPSVPNNNNRAETYGLINHHHLSQLKENHQQFSDEYDSKLKQTYNNPQKNGGTLRSKTPGPELFRDRTNINNMSANNIYYRPQFEQQSEAQYDHVSSPTKYNTMTNHQYQQQQRSKTPTTDLYYSQNQRNDCNFDTIYQPFIPRKKQQQQQIYNSTSQSDIYGASNIEYKTIDIIVELHRQDSGFGFRIVGGDEEGSQVAVGYIVPNGSADVDARLKPNDEIIMIDNENVVGALHTRVVQLMTIAALNRKVKLWVKRKVPISIGGLF
jgi:C-terminal processing protease CtpA/Prc